MLNSIRLKCLAAAAAISLCPSLAWASPPSNWSGERLVAADLNETIQVNDERIKFQTKGPTDTQEVKLFWQAGGSSGWHSHPGGAIVVVKQGSRGATATRGGEVFRAPGFRVETVDTTGAGDSFAAGFVSAWLDGSAIDDCLRAGNACGALSTRAPGGTDAQPLGAELRAFLRRHPATPTDRGRTNEPRRRSNG